MVRTCAEERDSMYRTKDVDEVVRQGEQRNISGEICGCCESRGGMGKDQMETDDLF